MERLKQFLELGWRHPLWEILRFYRALGGAQRRQEEWLELVTKEHLCSFPGDNAAAVPIDENVSTLLNSYIKASAAQYKSSFARLRTEEEAVAYCESLGVAITRTTTQSADHHQSPKALAGSVAYTAVEFCHKVGIEVDPNPQNRCVWTNGESFHVTARRLDGAIPSLVNPKLVWEIKEYWGKTRGGSKMSDAVYECQLVGKELRAFEEKTGTAITHVVFLDGLEQWRTRRSDFVRFVDLANQGLIDYLIVGEEVEDQWARLLSAKLSRSE